MRVRVTTSAVDKQYELHILRMCLYSCFIYPTFEAHLFCAALCYRLWPVWLYGTCPHISLTARYIQGGLFFFWERQPPVGHGFLIHEVSRSHTTTRHSR